MSDVKQDLDLHDDEERDDTVIVLAFRWSLVVLLFVGVIGGGTAWWFNRPEPVAPEKETPLKKPAVRELPRVDVPSAKFTDITEAAGIDFIHENGAAGEKLLPETMGGGCAFFDYDNDGDQDLLLINGRRWAGDERPSEKRATSALYRNDGTGKFENVTAEVGLDVSLYGMGVAVGDYDGDGWRDLFISTLGANRLFRNVKGKFTDVTDAAGVAGADDVWGTSCGWFDYDADGDLDLFVCNYVGWSKKFDLAQPFTLDGKARAYGRPQDFPGTFPYLYQNDGTGKFSDVSAKAGIQIKNPQTGVPAAKSLGVTFADLNRDGFPDVIVANDTVQNFLFLNQQNGTFTEVGSAEGIAFDVNGQARGAMGVDAASFRNDDSIGVAVGNFSNEMTALYVSTSNGLGFVDEAVSNGMGPVTRLELTFGLFFFDYDLDGRLDLLAANGHLEEEINKVQSSQHYEQPPHLLWNAGPEHATEFVTVTAEKCGNDLVRPMAGRGMAFSDIDDGGDLDVLIAASGRKPRLLRNDLENDHHWLRFKLTGSRGNRDAIGARIEVRLGEQVLQQQVMPTRGYLSQSELPVTFGLGTAEKVDKVIVSWPDGSVQELTDVAIDQLHRIRQTTN